MGIFHDKNKRKLPPHKEGDWVLIRRPRRAIPDRSTPPNLWPPRRVAKVDNSGHVYLYEKNSTQIGTRPFKHEHLAPFRGYASYKGFLPFTQTSDRFVNPISFLLHL